MSADANRPRSLLERFRTADPVPTPAPAALEPVASTLPATEKKKVIKPLSFARLAKLVSKETDGFQAVIGVAVGILNDDEAEPRDRIKAMEFLSKWADPNPAMAKREVTVSGPDGRPIAHAHAHVHIGGGDLAKLTDEELATLKRIYKGALQRTETPRELGPARDVIDVEVET